METCAYSLQELPNFFEEFAYTVRAAEGARRKGTLDLFLQDEQVSRILGVNLAAQYQRINDEHADRLSEFHDFWISCFLSDSGKFLLPPRASYRGEAEVTTILGTDPPRRIIAKVCVEHCGTNVEMRHHQIIAARRWGVEIFSTSEEANALIVKMLIGFARSVFLQNLSDLRHIENAFKDWSKLETFDREAISLSLAFEDLFMDVLNEEKLVARKAPLFEDLYQKTDLRVTIPQLKRQRGERLQVAMSHQLSRIEEKQAHITYKDEIILLSPWTLATFAYKIQKGTATAALDLQDLWHSLPKLPASCGELASTLRQLCVSSISLASEHPLGASGFLPTPVKTLTRNFVWHDALRCHQAMRDREARDGTTRYKYRSDRF